MTKFCVDCRHSTRVITLYCEHPSVGISPIDGKCKVVPCTYGRWKDSDCDVDGKLFEPKPTLKEKIWHILKLK